MAEVIEPSAMMRNKKTTLIDLVAGIGSMRLAFEKAGGTCVWSSEWDRACQETYEANFGERPAGDITKIPPTPRLRLAGKTQRAFRFGFIKIV